VAQNDIYGQSYDQADRVSRPESVLQVTDLVNSQSGALVVKARAAGADSVRVRFKAYGGGNGGDDAGGSGFGVYFMTEKVNSTLSLPHNSSYPHPLGMLPGVE